MQKIITTLKDILTPLCKLRRDVWPNDNWERIYADWPPLAREDLEALFGQSETGEVDSSKSTRGKVIYLPPPEKDPDCVPILSLYFKLKETQSIAKLRVLLAYLDENRKPHGIYGIGIYGIGFRMETPEKINQGVNSSVNSQRVDTTDNSGAHDFHHAQLIRKFGQRELDDKLKIDCPTWLPQSQPSFPLPAKCPVTLLLCLIVTLYGGRYYNRFITEHEIFDIGTYLQELNQWINQEANLSHEDW